MNTTTRLLTAAILLAGLALFSPISAQAGPTGDAGPRGVPPPNDDCFTAIDVVVGASVLGDTSGAAPDAPSYCGYPTTAPGLWYSVIGTGNTMTASTCNGVTAYDSILNVYCGGDCLALSCVAANDDGCEDGPATNSTVRWCSTAGEQYFVLVHGYEGYAGAFQLDIGDDGLDCGGSGCSATDVSCPPDATLIEIEPDCGLPVDTVNGGCNSVPQVFTPISLGDIVCGTGGSSTSTTDLDWYELVLTEARRITWSVRGDFPVRTFIATPDPDCANLAIVASGVADPFETSQLAACLPAGTHYLIAGPYFFYSNIPCGTDYIAAVTDGPCVADSLQSPGTTQAPPGIPGNSESNRGNMGDTRARSVSLWSGAFNERAVDLRVKGRGLDFVMARTYSSRKDQQSAMGHGWDFSYNIYLEQQGGDFILHDGNGRQDLYQFNPGTGTWVNEEFFREMFFDPGSLPFEGRIEFADRGRWFFKPFGTSPDAGKIGRIEDRNGNALEFNHNPLTGQLQTVIDTLGRAFQFTYGPDGFLDAVIDFTGRAVTYQHYNAGDPSGDLGDLRSVTTPPVLGTPHGNDFPAGKTMTYTYSTGSVVPELNHNLLTITDPKGQTHLVNTYATTTLVGDPDFDHLIRQAWGDPNDIIDLVYVPQVPLPSNNHAVIKTIVNDRVGNVSETYFDGLNRGVIEQVFTGRAGDDIPTTPVSNRPTAPLRPTDPPLFETRYEYNASSLAQRIVDPNGNEELFFYDTVNPSPRARGNLMQHTWLPGPLGGDQPLISESFQYDPGLSGDTNQITFHQDGRGAPTTHVYDPNGNRMQTVHRDGVATDDYQYDPFGQLIRHILPANDGGWRREDVSTYVPAGPGAGQLQTRTVDALGVPLTTTYEYDALGRVTRTIDPRGHDSTLEYNALDQIVRSLSRETTAGSGIRYETLNYYDANNNVVRVDLENRDETGAPQPNTHFTTIYEYDILNNMTRDCSEKGSENVGPGVTSCDGVDAAQFLTTETEYDANRRPTLKRSGEAVNGNDPTATVRTLYDERDLVFRVISAEGSPNQSSAQFDYDGNRNPVRTTTGLESTSPRTVTNTYDGYDRLTSTVDPMGNETIHQYDSNHNPVHIEKWGEHTDLPGNAGNVRLYSESSEFDAMDRAAVQVIEHFDEAGLPIGDGQNIIVTQYSQLGQIISVADDSGASTTTQYDSANRVLLVTDPKSNTIQYTYDANSNVVETLETEKSDLGSPDQTFATTFQYDSLNRMTSKTDSVLSVTRHEYDSRDNRVVTIDAENNETRTVYDGLSRQTGAIRDMDGDGADGDGADIVTLTAYDDNSRKVGDTNDIGHSTTYAYDGLDRLFRTTHADGTEHFSEYDAHSNSIHTLDANGTDVVNTFDLLGRLTGRSITPGPDVSHDTTFENFQYDGLGRLRRAEDNDAVVTQRFDSLSRVVEETLNGQPVASVWDARGNKTSLQYPDGRMVDYAYDAMNRIATVSDNLIGPIAEYSYFGSNRVEQRRILGVSTTDFQYNPAKMISRTTTVGPIPLTPPVDDRSYDYDLTGNKRLRADLTPTGPRLTHTYEYDAISRLTRTVVTDPLATTLRDTTYNLDGGGNRNNVFGPGELNPGLYSLDSTLPSPADEQMNQYTQTPSDAREYDANGNLIRIGLAGCVAGDVDGNGVIELPDADALVEALLGTASHPCADVNGDTFIDGRDIQPLVDALTTQAGPTGQILFTYDYRNRMITASGLVNDAVSATYAYDAFGRRIAKTVDTGAPGAVTQTLYTYDGFQVIAALNTGTGDTTTYVYGNYVDEVLTSRTAGADIFYVTDDMFNVMAITDVFGNVLERYEYGDYGQPLDPNTLMPAATSAFGNGLLFQGRRYDPETGFYYYRTRYLDPITGRFTTRAAIGIFGDVFGNSYTFLANNPWTWLDPVGKGVCFYRWWWWPWYRYQWWCWWSPYRFSGYYTYYWWWWYPYRHWLWWWYPYRWVGYSYWWWSPYWKYGWFPYRWCWWPYRWYWWWYPYRWYGYHYGWYWWWYSWRCWVWYPYGSSWWWWWYPHGWCGYYGWYWNWWHPYRWYWYGYWYYPYGWWGCGSWWYWCYGYRWYVYDWCHWWWWPSGYYWYPYGWWGCYWGWHLWWYPYNWWWWTDWWYPYAWWGWVYGWYWWSYPYGWLWWYHSHWWWGWHGYGWWGWWYGWYWHWWWGWWVGWWWWWPSVHWCFWWHWWPWLW